ncbi:hypothetical protein CXB51_004090 [Gossypium anomalum]|uniref:Alpha-carbonic anhydrase domain-containing protein n=1 Tax=Gossypium anomalum TaxID=47600 RepID=A0A8J5ZJG7_9ROSI|nr:hypothetical protein CXB51_004090 [Gossypium anomalum]
MRFDGETRATEINGTELHFNSVTGILLLSIPSMAGEPIKKMFDLEAHLIHESAYGKSAVTGIMYKIERPDPFLLSASKNIYFSDVNALFVPACTENVVSCFVQKVHYFPQN